VPSLAERLRAISAHLGACNSHLCDACSNILGGSRTCRFNKALVETELAISASATAAYPGDKCAARSGFVKCLHDTPRYLA